MNTETRRLSELSRQPHTDRRVKTDMHTLKNTMGGVSHSSRGWKLHTVNRVILLHFNVNYPLSIFGPFELLSLLTFLLKFCEFCVVVVLIVAICVYNLSLLAYLNVNVIHFSPFQLHGYVRILYNYFVNDISFITWHT